MAEIGINESKVDVPKVMDIKPNSEISMDDCNQFWNDVFGKEIAMEDVPRGEKTKSNFESAIQSAKDFWNDIFSENMEEDRWSYEIVDSIRNMDEYKIYKDAGLVEGEVNGKKCLMRTDIDWDQKDQFESTNRERVAEGYAPLDKTGKPIQLHHIGQRADSPLAELTFKEHRTGGNDTILHDKTKETEVHGEGNDWDNERKDYWKNRQPDGGGLNEQKYSNVFKN